VSSPQAGAASSTLRSKRITGGDLVKINRRNFKMKKYISLFTLLTVLFVSSCSKKQSDDKVTIRFIERAQPAVIEVSKKIIALFEQTHPDIKVKLVTVPDGELVTKILTETAGGDPADVFINADIYVPSFAKKDSLLQIDGLIAEDKEFDIKDFYPVVLDTMKYNNKLYGLPVELGGIVMFYNKTMFDKEKVGYPTEKWTWKEFLDAAKKLTKDTNGDGKIDQYGYQSGITWTGVFMPWVWQNGGDFLDKTRTKCVVNNPKTIEALQFYVDLITKYKVSPTMAQMREQDTLFYRGKIGMMYWARGGVPSLRKYATSFEWDAAPLPRGKAGAATVVGMHGYSISSKTKYPKESWEFLKFFVSKECQELLMAEGDIVPVRKSMAGSNVYTDSVPPKNGKVFIDWVVSCGQIHPIVPNFSEIQSVISYEFELMFMDKKTVPDACRDMEQKINVILSK
jgi:multiple sugar transport system substrate-binding protein